ncbi:MAG: hypothetical protein NVSMB9_04330 [Isosphaeraceae bacterium]
MPLRTLESSVPLALNVGGTIPLETSKGGISGWPWWLMTFVLAIAVWHRLDFPDDLDAETPQVHRPTFNRVPPPALRLAEPGDTIDRIAIYLSGLSTVLSLYGLCRTVNRRRVWWAAAAISIAAFWRAANPGPTFDGWYGLGWYAVFNSRTPGVLRAGLIIAAMTLAAIVFRGLAPTQWARTKAADLGQTERSAGLFGTALLFLLLSQFEYPFLEPVGYWPRWAFVIALVAYASALARVLRSFRDTWRTRLQARAWVVASVLAWLGLTAVGIFLTWFHRPLDRLREVVPGKIFISAMPTGRGLEIAQARHHFKTIINLFPENGPLRSPRLPQELSFVAKHGVRYIESPGDVESSDEFMKLTLRIAQDPKCWPILVHCHGCMDRTPAWVGIYRFVVEGRSLREVFQFIEGHRGYRPKASVTLLYNRVLPWLAPRHYEADPTAALLRRCAAGLSDRPLVGAGKERSGVNKNLSGCVRTESPSVSSHPLTELDTAALNARVPSDPPASTLP